MHALKSALKWGMFLLALAALLLLIAYGSLKTRWGQEKVAAFLESELDAEIEGLSGTLPFAPRIESLALKDTQGTWLILENVALEWSVKLSPLTWRIKHLRAESVRWLRLPRSGQEAPSTFSMPALPRVEIRRFTLPRIEIEESVTGQRQLLAAEGDLRTFASDVAATSHFRLYTLEGPETALTIVTSGWHEMTLEAAFAEEAGGIVGTMIGLPDRPLFAVTTLLFKGEERLSIEKAFVASNGIQANVKGLVRSPFSEPVFAIEGETKGMGHFSETLAKLAPRGVQFNIEGERSGGDVRITTFRARTEHVLLEGKELRVGGGISGALQLFMPDARMLHDGLKGALTVQAGIDGTLAAPRARVNAALKDEGWLLKVATSMRMKGDSLHAANLKGGIGGLGFSGTIIYDTRTALAKGTLAIDASGLSDLSPFFADKAKGSGKARITLDGVNGKQLMEAQGSLANVGVGDISAAALYFRFHAADIVGLEGIDAEARVSALTIGDAVVDSLTLSAKGNGMETSLTLDAESKSAPALKMHAAGTLKANLPDWALTLGALDGEFDGNIFALAAPATIVQEAGWLTLTPLRVNVAQGSIEATGSYSVPRVDLRFALARLPLRPLTKGALEGMLNGDIHVAGAAERPNVAFKARVTGLASALKEKDGFALGVTGALTSGNLALQAQIEDVQGSLRAEARLPARFALSPFQLELPPDGRLSGNLRADAKIGPLLALLLPEEQTLSGHARGDLALRGTLGAPWLEGALNLKNGRYVNRATGTTLKNMDIHLETRRDKLTVSHGSVRAGDGRIALMGDIGLKSPYPFSLRAKLDNAEVIDSREASGVVNGTVQLSGDMSAQLVAGDVMLGPMEIRLPESGDVEVPVVKIRNPEVLPAQIWQREGKSKQIMLGPNNVRLNVRVKTRNRVYLRGRGLEAEMRGEVLIDGTLGAPAIEGRLRTARGAFTLLDRQLNITEGMLSFRGAMPPSPYVRMLAETAAGELMVGIRLEGPARDPELTLTSTPPRPEDEIMAHLLFGRELRSITPFQGIQLAQAIQTLRGKGGGMDLLGKARNLLGVDRLNIGENDSGDLGVGAGKHISDKLYISVEGGTDPHKGKVKAEIEVSQHFSVETETGGRSSGARFNWKRDY